MEISSFIFAKGPKIIFGREKINELPQAVSSFGKCALLVTGSSFRRSKEYTRLLAHLKASEIKTYETTLSGEPTPAYIDKTTAEYKDKNIEVVLGIGGGSIIDAGKALSAMLLCGGSVKQYLEGMETQKHSGIKLPFIAVPTSSGTGSEATKNAVLSEIGEKGFKSSLRHDNFVPDIALVDPTLALTCPPEITAACGLDSLTQLLESYVSTNASPITDTLVESGFNSFRLGFLKAFTNGSNDITARENMSYASLISGIALANSGLGVVHGFASPIGGYFNIPHGVVCGILLAEATKMNIEIMLNNPYENRFYLKKYAKASSILLDKYFENIKEACDSLTSYLEELVIITKLPKLSDYLITEADIDKIVQKTSNKNNPVKLNYKQLSTILKNKI